MSGRNPLPSAPSRVCRVPCLDLLNQNKEPEFKHIPSGYWRSIPTGHHCSVGSDWLWTLSSQDQTHGAPGPWVLLTLCLIDSKMHIFPSRFNISKMRLHLVMVGVSMVSLITLPLEQEGVHGLQLLGLGFDDLCGSCLCSGETCSFWTHLIHMVVGGMQGGRYTESSTQSKDSGGYLCSLASL